jgi:hypothetical protein
VVSDRQQNPHYAAHIPFVFSTLSLGFFEARRVSPGKSSYLMAQRNKELARNHKTVLPEKPILPAMPHMV